MDTKPNRRRTAPALLAGFAALASLLFAAAPASAADPNQGPGGPILVISGDSNPFGRYYAEILRNEGLNEFDVANLSNVTQPMLDSHDVVILGETRALAGAGDDALRLGQGRRQPDRDAPGRRRSPACSASPTPARRSPTATWRSTLGASGRGHRRRDDPVPRHGRPLLAHRRHRGRQALLRRDHRDRRTPRSPTARSARTAAQAAAFTYDLARSVVYTRQGNPAWAGQDRDGVSPIRSNDLFFGNASGDPQPDWVDLDKVDIPQADEQQRLLANLIGEMNLDETPLPRFWYFPRGEKAAIVMTGDDHGNGGTAGRFNAEQAESTVGCSVADWECVRSTSYIFPSTRAHRRAAAATRPTASRSRCIPTRAARAYSAAGYDGVLTSQLNALRGELPGDLRPGHEPQPLHRLERLHDYPPRSSPTTACASTRTTTTGPRAGCRTAPACSPAPACRCASPKTDGSMIDVYQATTQMTDESGQAFPATRQRRCSTTRSAPRATTAPSPPTCTPTTAFHAGWQAIVDSAQSRGVPVDHRPPAARVDRRPQRVLVRRHRLQLRRPQLQRLAGRRRQRPPGMVPVVAGNGDELAGVEHNGNPVTTNTQTIKGVEYAFFTAAAGSYEATYEAPPPPSPEATHTSVSDFTAGTHTGTHVTDDNGGEVILKPEIAEEFSGAGLPASFGYSGNWGPGGSQTVSGGSLNVDGGYAGTTNTYGSGRSLEFKATFQPTQFTHVGFGVDYDTDPTWAMFSVKGDGNFYARTNPGDVETPLPGGLLGSAHRYRIEWGASEVKYFVDGALVATHNVSIGIQLRPLASEFNEGGGSLSVDWLRMTPYASSGTYESAVIDAGEDVDWGPLSWTADEPAGTNVALSVRTGDTASPDGTWSAWTPVAASGDDVAGSSRYAQYRAEFTTSGPEMTAVLSDVTIGWSPVAAPGGDATDTTTADFEAGTRTGVHVTSEDDGEVILKPEVAEEFSGAGLPPSFGYSGAWSGGGAANVGGGSLNIDGAYAGTTNTYNAGRTLEFVATFPAAPFTHVGFGVDYNNDPSWLMFSVKNDGIYARTNPGGVETQLPSSLIGSPHRYRIEWGASDVKYYVDGALVATHNHSLGSTPLRPLASEFSEGGPGLSIDWLRMTPYANSGTFTSRVIDAGETVQWGDLSWNADTPAGTSLALSVRTGDTPTPDGTWSSFTSISASGDDIPGSSRYAQYRAEFTTSDTEKTAVLSDVTLEWSAADDNPVAVDDAETVDEDSGTSTFDVRANDTDADGGPKTIEHVTQPAHGTVAITNGGNDLTYAPAADYCNTAASGPGSGPDDTFTYKLNGGSTATVSVEVTCLDDNPSAVNDSRTVNEDSGATPMNVLPNDLNSDGGPITVASVNDTGTNGTVLITGGGSNVTYSPDAEYCNTAASGPGSGPDDTFTYTLNGGSTATVSVEVTCLDDNPSAVNDSRTVNEDSGATPMNVLPNDLNADGGPITITGTTNPAHGTINVTGGGSNITYAPAADYCNSDGSGPGSGPDDTFTYTLNGGSTATVSVEVTCLPDGSDTTDPEIDIRDPYESGRYSIEANPKPELNADYDCSDADSGIASCVGTVADGAPFDRSSPGTKTFTVTATDNAGNTATKTVTYRVFTFRNFMLDDSPIAYYRMGDPAGSQTMHAEVGPDGEYKNGQSSGPFGISGDGDTARLFTGADGYGYANGITAPRSYTLNAFFKLDDSGNAMILQHGSAGAIWHSGGMVRFRPVDWLGVELDSGAGSVTPGVWHQVAATYKWVPDPNNPQLGTGTARLYLDGNHVDARTADKQTSGTSTFYVGYGDKAPWLRGLVDEVAYYPTALSHTHLHEIWLADPPPPAEQPTGGSGSGGTGGGGSGDTPAPPTGGSGSGDTGSTGGSETTPSDGGSTGSGDTGSGEGEDAGGIEIGTASATGKWLTVKVSCDSDCEGRLSARKGSLKLGMGDFEAKAGEADVVQMKLTKKGTKAVKKGGSITVTIAGPDGEQTKTVALRRR